MGDEHVRMCRVAAIANREREGDEAKGVIGMTVQPGSAIERRGIEKGHPHAGSQESAEPAAAQVAARKRHDHVTVVDERWGTGQRRVGREAGPVAGDHTRDVVSAHRKRTGKPGDRVAKPTRLRERRQLGASREDSQMSNSSVWPKSARPTTTIPSSLTVNRARSRSMSSPITSPGGIRTPLSTIHRRSRAPLPTSTPGKSTLSNTLL